MIVLIIASLYALLVGFLYYGWKSTPVSDKINIPSVKRQGLSIIVAMRNEQGNIGKLLNCLMQQQINCPMEVIIVDDSSTDDSVAEATTFKDLFSCPLQIVPCNGKGKKAAISTGISIARFPVILTTDADCRMGARWAQTMYEALQAPGVQLVTGLVRIAPADTWLARFQAIEMAALMGSTAAFTWWKMPNMGNGANFGYWREVFEQTGGYHSSQTIASGDDEFLIQQVHDSFPGSIRFVKAADAVVTTAPKPNWQAVFMQRRRWAAKWRKGRPFRVWGVALFVGLFHLFWTILPLVIIISPDWLPNIIVALSLKLATEYVFLNAVLQVVRQKTLTPYILPLQLVYSFYVVWVGVRAASGGYVWKERTFTR
jgi:glycosyltransferase involved in cell wall biosynthesis